MVVSGGQGRDGILMGRFFHDGPGGLAGCLLSA